MSPPRLTHLICDCDGVLLDSESIALRVLHEQLQPLLKNMADSSRLHHAIAVRLGMFTARLLAELDVAFGFGLTTVQAEAINQAVMRACADEVQAVPGIAEALQQIALPKAVASNSSQLRIAQGLQRCALLPLFSGHIHSADDVAQPKPAPDVYLAAAAGFGVAPQHCIAVDDSVTGVRSAVAAGMRVLGFIGVAHDKDAMAQQLHAAGAELVFDQMSAFPGVIAALLAAEAA